MDDFDHDKVEVKELLKVNEMLKFRLQMKITENDDLKRKITRMEEDLESLLIQKK